MTQHSTQNHLKLLGNDEKNVIFINEMSHKYGMSRNEQDQIPRCNNVHWST